jgi:hypothetical protein
MSDYLGGPKAELRRQAAADATLCPKCSGRLG